MQKFTKTKIFNPLVLIYLFFLFTSSLSAQENSSTKISIIPEPVSIKPGEGNFTLTGSTLIVVPTKLPEIRKAVDYFINKINPATGFDLQVSEASGEAMIQFSLNSITDAQLGNEGYTLEAGPSKILIKANKPAGLFYGAQTLLQLLPPDVESQSKIADKEWLIPAVSIVDYPRFGWRGFMLDVSRHFFSKETVKEIIDQKARYKFNRFHLHLTDDNGWRIGIKSLPKLTEIGAWRVERHGTWGTNEMPKPGEPATYGGFYSQEEMKEIIEFAKDRYIEILPEIDVPGHSMAALAAYPELSVTEDSSVRVNPGTNFATWHDNGKFTMYIDNTLNPTDENVYQFLDKVFTEVAQIFPFEYIHMGGDEAYKGYWERDAGVQAFMKNYNIKNVDELQSYFNTRVGKIISSKGKKMIGWDEILEGGLPPGAAVMSWQGMKGGIEAAHQNANVVMSPSPMAYLDLYQGDPSVEPPTYSMARLKDSYKWDPVPEGVDQKFIMGGQGNLWTEHITNKPQIEYMAYPRVFALSEIYWSPKVKKNWKKFAEKVEDHFERFDQARQNYSQSMYDPIIRVSRNGSGNLILDLSTEVDDLEIYYTLDNSIPNQYYSRYTAPVTVPKDAPQLRVRTFRNGEPMGKLISIKNEDLQIRVSRK